MDKFLKYLLIKLLCLSTSSLLSAQQTGKIYLSGTGPADAKQWQFMCTGGMNANKWTTIAVPSCWELQGFGKYDYGFAKDSVRGKEQGLYKHEFLAPSAWKGKTVNIVFEGVMTDADVKINGQSAGEIHQGAFYAFKYDITKLLKYGEQNLLEVTVSKHSANQSVNEAERKADYWLFGGIFRPVWLEVLPYFHFDKIWIDAKADGSFSAYVNTSDVADDITLNIFDPEGKPVGKTRYSEGESFYAKFRCKDFIPISNLWTPETPRLYTAVFSILDKSKTIYTVAKKFGYRTVEVKQRDGIYVNGVKVKMKGVNRSPFRPETGRTLSKEQSIEDVLLIKDMNMNAVRCSHYPPDEHF
jgi:beta-galactosidase/beta-glucuronidase